MESNKSHVDPKRDEYERPWAVNAKGKKPTGKGGAGDKKD